MAAFNRLVPVADTVLREIQGVKTAPPPAEEIAAGLVAQLKALAKPPRVDSAGRLALPQMSIAFTDKGPQMVPDVFGVLAWAIPDALATAVGALPLPGAGMSAAERRDQLAALYSKLVDALRVEAATATVAEKAGQRVVRRRHVHPAILIGTAVDPVGAYDYLTQRKGT